VPTEQPCAPSADVTVHNALACGPIVAIASAAVDVPQNTSRQSAGVAAHIEVGADRLRIAYDNAIYSIAQCYSISPAQKINNIDGYCGC
jgi:hypothetical protein